MALLPMLRYCTCTPSKYISMHYYQASYAIKTYREELKQQFFSQYQSTAAQSTVMEDFFIRHTLHQHDNLKLNDISELGCYLGNRALADAVCKFPYQQISALHAQTLMDCCPQLLCASSTTQHLRIQSLSADFCVLSIYQDSLAAHPSSPSNAGDTDSLPVWHVNHSGELICGDADDYSKLQHSIRPTAAPAYPSIQSYQHRLCQTNCPAPWACIASTYLIFSDHSIILEQLQLQLSTAISQQFFLAHPQYLHAKQSRVCTHNQPPLLREHLNFIAPQSPLKRMQKTRPTTVKKKSSPGL